MYLVGINVFKPIRKGNKVIIDFNVPKSIEKFFNKQSFSVEYDNNINLSTVPESILVIPLLSNILPVAWFSGVNVYVEEIDEKFYNAIPNIQAGFKNLYPKIKMRGKLKAKRIIKNNMKFSSKSAQLFSGGVDSLATYIRRISEKPELVTIWGADVDLNDINSWEKVKQYNLQVATEFETSITFIKSNFTKILNTSALGEEYSHLINGFHWWPGVQHGLGLAGLCSPLTYEKEISTFYIPASDTAEFKNPWGSHPAIDNEIKWANTEVVHESYDFSRQDKIRLISRFIKANKDNLQIRVCWQSDHNGGNCSKCEKCSRTIMGLIVEAINPNLHGFNVPENFFQYVKENITKGSWSYSKDDQMSYWRDIQKNIHEEIQVVDEEYRDLVYWFKNLDFERINKRPFLVKMRRHAGRFLNLPYKKNYKKV